MNIHDNFEKKLDYISMFNGVCLNIEEKLKLEIAFNELHKKEKMEELWFWGKIYGTEFDYFITLGINFTGHYEFPEKKFYITSSKDYTFVLLPKTFEYHDKDNIENYNNAFTGNPNLILKKYVEDVDPDFDPNAIANVVVDMSPDPNNVDGVGVNKTTNLDVDESVDNIPVVEEKKENFTELLKLSYTVLNIDYDTNIVPQGAYRLIPIHELRKNESFRGLKPEDLRNFKKFHHFRPISNPKNKELIENDDAIFRFDLLDNIDEDKVKGSWGIQLDSTKTIVIFFIKIFSAISEVYYGLDILQFINLIQMFLVAHILEME